MDFKNPEGKITRLSLFLVWHTNGYTVVFRLFDKDQAIGRVDVSPLEEVTAEIAKNAFHLCLLTTRYPQPLQQDIEKDFARDIDAWFANPPAVKPKTYHFSPEH